MAAGFEFNGVEGTFDLVDPNTDSGGAPEGTSVLSTGETGGSKFLGEDGDGTSSWKSISGGGHAIQEEGGTALTQRANLDFVGPNVTATDGGAGPDSTIITVDVSDKQDILAEGAFVDGDKTDLDANTVHRTSDGKNHSDVVLNNTHRTSTGADHSYIDQSVVSGASPTFDGANITGVDAANVDIADAGGKITATDVEGALQENRTAIDLNTAKVSYTDAAAVGLNTTHRTSDGSDHSFIDQDVTNGAAPVLDATNMTNLPTGNATHTGEVTGSGALTIADNIVDEANLKLDTTPTDDYVLTADAAASGGMKWAEATGGAADDTAYDATSWNANTDAATKNAIRDKIETMDTAIGSNTSASHAELHTIASHSDTTATGAELETLTDGSNADALHTHAGGSVPAVLDGDANNLSILPTATADNPNYAIVSAQATTNLAVNPRFEVNVSDGWSDYGTVTRSRTTSEQKWGAASMQLTSSSASAGATLDAVAVDASSTYIFSCWVKGAVGGERMQMSMKGNVSGEKNNGAFSIYGNNTPVTTEWKRFRFWYVTGATDSTLLARVYTNDAATQTIYIDGVQLEKNTFTDPSIDLPPTPYCDGALGKGHTWSGTADNSSSSRTAGTHYLGPIGQNSKGSMVQLQDGSFDGKMHFHSDWGFKSHSNSGFIKGKFTFPYIVSGDVETDISASGAVEGLALFRNHGNGAAAYVKSGVTTKEGFVLDFSSLTSGAGMIVYAPATLDAMIAAGGVFFKFAGKAENSDMYKWGGDYFSAGDLGFSYDKRMTIYGGAGQTATERTFVGQTVAYSGTTVTGTGTSFLTDFKRGDSIQINKSAAAYTVYTVASVTSNAVLTTTTAVGTGTGKAFKGYTSQYSPATIQLEGNYGNHQAGDGDYLYNLYPSGGNGQPRWMKSSAIEDTSIPTADNDGSAIVVGRHSDVATHSIASGTTQTDVVTGYTIPAYELQSGNTLRIKFFGDMNMVSGTDTVTWTVQMGTTVLLTSVARQPGTGNAMDIEGEVTIAGDGTNSQLTSIKILGQEASATQNGPNYSEISNSITSAADSRIDKALTITAQFSGSGGAMNIYYASVVLEQ